MWKGEGRGRAEVCGEDGETYASYCDLMKISCIKQTNIQVAYEGQCSMGNFLQSKTYSTSRKTPTK